MSLLYNETKAAAIYQMYDGFTLPSSANTHVAIGRNTGWNNVANANALTLTDMQKYEFWNNMIGGKLLTAYDVRMAARRIDWTANTVYFAYDSENTNLANSDFYVMNSTYDVYKCLANSAGANSSVEPTSKQTTTPFNTADGYVWKYLFTLTQADRLRFMTDDYIPVKIMDAENDSLQWDVQENATPGEISNIKMISTGSGYVNADDISITISGDGTGALAEANVTANGEIDKIVLTSYGQDYSYGTVSILSVSGGAGASANVVLAPPMGHGSNPAFELFANAIIVDAQISGTEDGVLPVNVNYNQAALIQNPLKFGTSNVYPNTVFAQFQTLTISGTVGTFEQEEVIYQGNSPTDFLFRADVLDYDAANNAIKYINSKGYPRISTTITGANSSATATVTSNSDPSLIKYSGQMLYVTNFNVRERNENQTDNIKVVITF